MKQLCLPFVRQKRGVCCWTDKMVRILTEAYPWKGKTHCANLLGVSEQAIRYKASHLGLRQNRNSDFFKDWQKRAAMSKIGKKRPEQALVLKRLHDEGKMVKTEKQREAMSLRSKEWHKTHRHPRGYLGRKHTPEALIKMSEASKRAWGNPLSKINSEESRQKKSDIGIRIAKNNLRLNTGYSRGKVGKREDLGGAYFRSKWEANYARYLNWLKKIGAIYDWQYEPEEFEFCEIKRGCRFYLPDFKVWQDKGSQPFFVEIKGWMDNKSKTKLSRMKKFYPDVDLRLVGKKEYSEIARKFKSCLSGWE